MFQKLGGGVVIPSTKSILVGAATQGCPVFCSTGRATTQGCPYRIPHGTLFMVPAKADRVLLTGVPSSGLFDRKKLHLVKECPTSALRRDLQPNRTRSPRDLNLLDAWLFPPLPPVRDNINAPFIPAAPTDKQLQGFFAPAALNPSA